MSCRDTGSNISRPGGAVKSESMAEEEEEAQLSGVRLALSSIAAIIVVAGAAAAVGYWLREPLLEAGHVFVDNLGGPGVAVGYLLPDAFTIPLPNDAVGMFGLAGGLSFWEVVAWGTAGSLAGGSIGWLVGRRLRRVGFVSRFLTRRGAKMEALIRRHGAQGVAIAAVTPLPYSLSAWAAGAVHMPFRTFFAVSLLRVFRVAGYLYLVKLGWLATAS